MILHALSHFLLRTIAVGAGLSGFAIVSKHLPITLSVAGGFALVIVGAAIFTASMIARAPTSNSATK